MTPTEAIGTKRADTSTVFTVAIAALAVSLTIAGWLQDELGPFPSSLTGCILMTLGFVLCSRTSSLTCDGLLVGRGSGLRYSTPMPVMAKWFPDNRGLAVCGEFRPTAAQANLWLIGSVESGHPLAGASVDQPRRLVHLLYVDQTEEMGLDSYQTRI